MASGQSFAGCAVLFGANPFASNIDSRPETPFWRGNHPLGTPTSIHGQPRTRSESPRCNGRGRTVHFWALGEPTACSGMRLGRPSPSATRGAERIYRD
jgi:hypothetical protein